MVERNDFQVCSCELVTEKVSSSEETTRHKSTEKRTNIHSPCRAEADADTVSVKRSRLERHTHQEPSFQANTDWKKLCASKWS